MSFDIKFTRHGFESAVDIARLSEILRILGESLLISSLPGKALRTFVDIARLAEIYRILRECLLISSLQDMALRALLTSRGFPRYREY